MSSSYAKRDKILCSTNIIDKYFITLVMVNLIEYYLAFTFTSAYNMQLVDCIWISSSFTDTVTFNAANEELHHSQSERTDCFVDVQCNKQYVAINRVYSKVHSLSSSLDRWRIWGMRTEQQCINGRVKMLVVCTVPASSKGFFTTSKKAQLQCFICNSYSSYSFI